MAEMQRTLVTKEGLENMQKELDELRSVKRAEVAQRLKEAIAMGDLRKTPNTMKRRMHRRSSKAASSSLNSRSVQHRSLKGEREPCRCRFYRRYRRYGRACAGNRHHRRLHRVESFRGTDFQ